MSHLHQVLFSCSPLSSLVNVLFVFELLSGPEPLRLLMPFAGEKQFKLIPGMFHLFDENPNRLTLKKAQRQQAVIGKQELGGGGTSRYSGLLWCGPVWWCGAPLVPGHITGFPRRGEACLPAFASPLLCHQLASACQLE